MLQDKYEAGDLGAKTGKGFYDWRGRDVEAYRRDAKDKMARLVAFLDSL